MFPSAGSFFPFNQTGGSVQPANNPFARSIITLVTGNVGGVSTVTWGGTILDFFGIYVYDGGEPISLPAGHSFSVIPEPGTAALIALGLLGLGIGHRRRA